jgi:ABC-type nickel/cobalt efflux system permease component RcnA
LGVNVKIKKMEQILIKLLEQSAVVVALGVGVWAIYKEKQKIAQDAINERKDATQRIDKLIKEHHEEIKEMSKDLHLREIKQLDTLAQLVTILEDVEAKQDKLLNKK